MCLYPKLFKNKKYTNTKKNGGNIPPVNDIRTLYVPIGCGKCIECRKQKARQWQARLLEDIKTNTNGKFITLTFSNESIKHLTEKAYEINEKRIQAHYNHKETNKRPKLLKGYDLDNELATIGIRHFLERWRKKYKKSIRHWLVTELGGNGTENIHLHGIMWTNESIEEIRNIWNYGYIWPRKETTVKTYVNEKTVNYIVKYINKQDEKHTTYNSIVLTSAGIGNNYINKPDSNKNLYKGEHTQETYRTRSGHKINLPIYWRNKLYSEEEKEKLWIQKLNKEERWVCGERIDISKGDEEYKQVLEYYRKQNTKLGYGNDKKNEKVKLYEQQRREIMQETRTKKQTPSAGSIQKGTD